LAALFWPLAIWPVRLLLLLPFSFGGATKT
jgi:hypothetical protein